MVTFCLTLDNTMIILGLGLSEVATIGVGTSVLICEGLGGDLLVDYDRGGGVCRGSVDHRGMVGNGGVVGNWAVGNRWAEELGGSKGTTKGCQGNENLEMGRVRKGKCTRCTESYLHGVVALQRLDCN